MSRYVLLRLVDTLFRRWWLLLLPIILLGAAGVYAASGVKDEYKAIGSINVSSDNLIDQLTQSSVDYGFRTPADVTSGNISQLLDTGEFVKTIAGSAGLSSALDSGIVTLDSLRKSVRVSASGDNLVKVSVTYDNPEVAFRVAKAAIDSFIQSQVDAGVSDSEVAINVFTGLVASYQTGVDTALGALNAYVADHPTQLDGSYSAEDTVQMSLLQAALTTATSKRDDAQSKLDDATLTRAQAETAVKQRFQVVDEPEQPTSRQPKVKKMVTSLALFLFLGGLLSAGALVLTAALDRTIRFPSDTEARLGVPTIAAVPHVRA